LNPARNNYEEASSLLTGEKQNFALRQIPYPGQSGKLHQLLGTELIK